MSNFFQSVHIILYNISHYALTQFKTYRLVLNAYRRLKNKYICAICIVLYVSIFTQSSVTLSMYNNKDLRRRLENCLETELYILKQSDYIFILRWK